MRNALRSLWQGWRRAAAAIGHFQTRLILSILYFVVMAPVAAGVRRFADPLGLRGPRGGTYWRVRDNPTLSLEQARRQ